ncbi:hypothetical protein ACFY4C_21450 [Actinomadura viridis]|uniref:hypothetical protein n=1 Tax=Actinomadura viridis TaxID=58110 RepID=UPI0036894F91
MKRIARPAAAALAAAALAVPGTAAASATGPEQFRPQYEHSLQNPISPPAAHRAVGSLWLYYDSFFSGQVQEVQDPGTTACVNLPWEFETWSQSSESSVNVQVFSQADCGGSADHTFAPNEYQLFLPLTVVSARFQH